MSPETLAALDASIKHWGENVKAETPSEASTTAKSCALCRVFDNCDGCPVAAATGEPQCYSTPYYQARDDFYRWRVNAAASVEADWRASALAELNFLKAIRPIGL